MKNVKHIEPFLRDLEHIDDIDAPPQRSRFLRVKTRGATYTTAYAGIPPVMDEELREQKHALEGKIRFLAEDYGLTARPTFTIVPDFTMQSSGALAIDGVEIGKNVYFDIAGDELDLYFRNLVALPIKEQPAFYHKPMLGYSHPSGIHIGHIIVNTKSRKADFWYHGHRKFNTVKVIKRNGVYVLAEHVDVQKAKLGDGALTHFLEML